MNLIHIISNEVTLETVVNAILASGGRAICANAPEEAAEITAMSDALVLNIGMPSAAKLDAMSLAGHKANELRIPVVLDPVGVGASEFRKQAVRRLLGEIHFVCVRGNAAEIAEICAMYGITDVDAEPTDVRQGDTEEDDKRTDGRFRKEQQNTERDELPCVQSEVDSDLEGLSREALDQLAQRLGTIVVATGAVNLVSDGERSFEIAGGSERLTKMTGGGCILSGLLGLFLSVKESRKIQCQEPKNEERTIMRDSATYGAHASAKNRVWDSACEAHGKSQRKSQPESQREGAKVYFDQVCECLTYYRDCAREAERVVMRGGHGTATFRTALIDAMYPINVTKMEDTVDVAETERAAETEGGISI